MAGISYSDLRRRLTPEALQMFGEMVDAHLTAGPGDKLFLRTDTMAGTGLIFAGNDSRRQWTGFDGGALDDLVDYGLLHAGYGGGGTATYRVGGEAIAFHGWLMEQEGAAVNEVENELHRYLAGSEFASEHPGAAHHLREAMQLLWQGRTDHQVVSEIGDHLRKALMDVTSDVVGSAVGGVQEKPIERLRAFLDGRKLSERERDVLVSLIELARTALRLDHRLNHLRDEADRGRSAATWDEIRRAAFVTTMVCYELTRA